VERADPVRPPWLERGPQGEPTVVVEIEKGGWIYIRVDDEYPNLGIRTVLAGDRPLPASYYWRVPGYVIVVDDPATQYRIVYEPPPPPPLWPWLAAGGVVIGGAVAWVEWPSVDRLRARPPPKRSLGWALRHCAACDRPLPRRARFLRALHACEQLAHRVAVERARWQAAPLAAKVTTFRRLLERVPWLIEPSLPPEPPAAKHPQEPETESEFAQFLRLVERR
jgi:hypothetical protein